MMWLYSPLTKVLENPVCTTGSLWWAAQRRPRTQRFQSQWAAPKKSIPQLNTSSVDVFQNCRLTCNKNRSLPPWGETQLSSRCQSWVEEVWTSLSANWSTGCSARTKVLIGNLKKNKHQKMFIKLFKLIFRLLPQSDLTHFHHPDVFSPQKQWVGLGWRGGLCAGPAVCRYLCKKKKFNSYFSHVCGDVSDFTFVFLSQKTDRQLPPSLTFTCSEQLLVDLIVYCQIDVVVLVTAAGEITVNRIVSGLENPEFVVF